MKPCCISGTLKTPSTSKSKGLVAIKGTTRAGTLRGKNGRPPSQLEAKERNILQFRNFRNSCSSTLNDEASRHDEKATLLHNCIADHEHYYPKLSRLCVLRHGFATWDEICHAITDDILRANDVLFGIQSLSLSRNGVFLVIAMKRMKRLACLSALR